MLLEQFLSKLENVTERGGRYEARCPAHTDEKNSLCVSAADDGKTLVHCQAGCETASVVDSIGCKVSDLFSSNGNGHANGKPKKRIVATYDYRGESSELLSQAVRFEPKDFRQRKPKPGGGWDWSVKGVRKVLYCLPELLKANIEDWIFVVEGEKDVDNAIDRGLVATCNAGGAGKWVDDYSKQLTGRKVRVVPDNDGPGKKHANPDYSWVLGGDYFLCGDQL